MIWVSVTVMAVVAFRLSTGLRRSRTSEGRHIVSTVWRGMRWRHVWPVPIVFLGVATVASLLWLYVPPSRFGWWDALSSSSGSGSTGDAGGGGGGSPMTGVGVAPRGSIFEWLVPLCFLGLLVPALPLWAFAEERIFRSNAEQWSWPKRVAMTVGFGLVHCIVGIPIAVAIALSVGGAYFMWVYLHSFRSTASARDATFESTRAHAAYNAMVLAVVLGATLVTAFEWLA